MMLEHGLVGAEPDVGVMRPSRVLVSPTTIPSRPAPGFSNDRNSQAQEREGHAA